jgi:zinc transporter ZupT
MCVVAFVSVCVVRLLDFLLLCVGGVMVSLYSLFSCLVQSVSNMILKKSHILEWHISNLLVILRDFKIVIIYMIFLEFIDNKKN